MGESVRQREGPFQGHGSRCSFLEALAVPLSILCLLSLLAPSLLLLASLSPRPVPQRQLLGESGTYYGVRFGKNVPWVTEFPFGYIKDPQYVGSIMSLLACLSWVPFLYILLWILGYAFMMHLESKEDPTTRAKPLS
ncbi:phosphatidyl-N-methylethanolamine N-methyltransferase isoform X2 [Malania oleifera]|uniref:phosphatidyl-N-methylethanolamine N-methyltransferase isoform X2 n=1 Tax=Malania oleifera TaxID=397392 RepID=UPI0025ADE0A3|nr:phosphatidyl-N-methylethanolamine N-methyltransferase isoform X2 [Malania oleifera]